MSDSLRLRAQQHARPPYPSPLPGAYPNSCPLSWWCHQTISSSVFPFSSCLQSFPASGSFLMSQFFTSGGQSIGVSASTSVLPMNTQDWFSFRMDWLDLLAVQGTLKSLLQHHCSKASILSCSTFFIVQFSHPYMTTGKTIALTRRTFVGKVMSLLFNINVLQGGLQKVIPMSSYSDPRDEILFGKGVFVDSIKIRRLGWDRPGLPKSPKFNDTYHYKGQKCWQPDSERWRMHDLETELRDLHPKTRDVWATKTWKRHGRTLP